MLSMATVCRNLKKCVLAQLLLGPGLTFWMILFTMKWNFIIFLGPVRQGLCLFAFLKGYKNWALREIFDRRK